MKLDLSEGNDFGGGVDNRAGAFVMYNCARLATLFKHFNKAVDDGINFSLCSFTFVLINYVVESMIAMNLLCFLIFIMHKENDFKSNIGTVKHGYREHAYNEVTFIVK